MLIRLRGAVLFALLLTLFVPCAIAQGARYDNVVWGSTAINGVTLPRLVGGATITVCAPKASGVPCSPVATVYNDIGLSSAKTNPFQADSAGNFGFFASPGAYLVCESGSGLQASCSTVTLGAGITGTATNVPTLSSQSATIGAINSIVNAASYPSIQAAINSCAAPGCRVFVPSGTYTLTSALSSPSTVPVDLECASKTSTVLHWTSLAGSWAINVLPGGSSIQHCTLEGPGEASNVGALNSGYDPWAPSTYYSAGDQVVPTFTGGQEAGLYFLATAGGTSAGSEPTWCHDAGCTLTDGGVTWTAYTTKLLIADNVFTGWGGASGGQVINTGGYNFGWVISGNEFREDGNEGVYSGSDSQRMLVVGNTFSAIGSNAIDFGGGSNNVAANNTIVDAGANGSFGVDTDGIQMAAIPGYSSSGNVATSNYIAGSGQSGVRVRAITSLGVDYTSSRDQVTGNTIVSPQDDCILLDTSALTIGGTAISKTDIAGNRCISPGRYGIYIPTTESNDTADTTISGNTVEGVSSSYADIFVGNQASDTIISSNHLLSSAPADNVIDSGINTISVANFQQNGTVLTRLPGDLVIGNVFQPQFKFDDGSGDQTALGGMVICGSANQFGVQPPGGQALCVDGSGGGALMTNLNTANSSANYMGGPWGSKGSCWNGSSAVSCQFVLATTLGSGSNPSITVTPSATTGLGTRTWDLSQWDVLKLATSVVNASGQTVSSSASAASNTVQPLAGATPHEWVTYADSAGVQHLSQPLTSDLGAASQTTITGTSAGSAVCSEPFLSSAYRKVLCYLNGYENSSATAQTYTFPVAFSNAGYLAHDDSGGSTTSATTLTLPASMASAKTGWVVVEGY